MPRGALSFVSLITLVLACAEVARAEPDCCDDPKLDCCRPTQPAQTQSTQTATPGKRDYPAALIERPLILPKLMAQVTAGVGLTHVNSAYSSDDAVGTLVSLGVDLGVTRRLQLGVFVAVPVYANADFDTFVADVQVALARRLNLRVDIGAKRVDGFVRATDSTHYSQDGFVLGVGLPLRVRLGGKFALVSGSASAHGFGNQPMAVHGDYNPNHYTYYGGSFVASSDLVTIWASPTYLLGAIMLPIGVVFQPHPNVLIGLHTGYRLGFARDANANTNLTHSVPLGLEVGVTYRHVDVGFTATLLGTIDDTYSNDLRWYESQQFDLHVAGRF